MASWDPKQYLRFGAERLRPALDLLQRIPLDAPAQIYDLGCGPGNTAELLQARWPEATLSGVDSSPAMLERARGSGVKARWFEQNLSEWAPDDGADLIFSNATLHWLDDHPGILKRWGASLAPGGVLAVQMPNNFAAATHTSIAEALRAANLYERAESALRPSPVLPPEAYFDLLAPRCQPVDIWQTTYIHVVEGDDPVTEWTHGSVLRPVLAALDDHGRERFLSEYRQRVQAAYPRRADGCTLLPFQRLFFVAAVR